MAFAFNPNGTLNTTSSSGFSEPDPQSSLEMINHNRFGSQGTSGSQTPPASSCSSRCSSSSSFCSCSSCEVARNSGIFLPATPPPNFLRRNPIPLRAPTPYYPRSGLYDRTTIPPQIHGTSGQYQYPPFGGIPPSAQSRCNGVHMHNTFYGNSTAISLNLQTPGTYWVDMTADVNTSGRRGAEGQGQQFTSAPSSGPTTFASYYPGNPGQIHRRQF